MIAVLDPESSNGALSFEEVRAGLLGADASYGKWSFSGDGG